MPLCGSVSFFNRIGFGHVFTLFRRAVEMRALSVVNMRFGVNPYEAVPSAWRGRVSRNLCGRTSRSRRRGRRRSGTSRSEQIAYVKLR